MSDQDEKEPSDAKAKPEEERSKEQDGEKKAPPHASLPERITLAVSIAVTILLMGFLGWHGWEQARPGAPDARPAVDAVVRKERAVSQSQGWAVPVVVINRGTVPLREVQVKIDVTDSDGKPGERELLFAFLAEGATEIGYVTTFTNPASAPPQATVQSFQTKADARGY